MALEQNKKTILVIEDEPALLRTLADALNAAGFSVIEAKDGGEGLRSFEKQPDLILLDLLLPKIGGIELLHKLRGSGEWGERVPVVVLTNLESPKMIASTLAEGSYDYLMKSSWSLSDVVKKVREKLGIREGEVVQAKVDTGKPDTVLVVEDEPAILHSLADTLTAEGFSVLEAKDGEEGLYLANKFSPDLILLDLVMPKLDGFSMVDKLHAEGKDIPVILLTNLSDDFSKAMAQGRGLKDFFVKSDWKLEDLVKKIKEKFEVK